MPAAGDCLSARARPAHDSRGMADGDCVGWDVAGDDGAGAHHGATPDSDRSDQDGLGAKRGAVLDERSVPVWSSRKRCAGVTDIRELRARSHQHVLT